MAISKAIWQYQSQYGNIKGNMAIWQSCVGEDKGCQQELVD